VLKKKGKAIKNKNKNKNKNKKKTVKKLLLFLKRK
jgi:hypothetical protein